MKKDQFLELAGQLFDQVNPSNEQTKVAIDKNTFDEIADRIASDIVDGGKDIVSDYTLEMYSREVELESLEFDMNDVERIIKLVLEDYFEIK